MKTIIVFLLFALSANADYVQYDVPMVLRSVDGERIFIFAGDCFPIVSMDVGKVRYRIGDSPVTVALLGLHVVRDDANSREWARRAVARIRFEHARTLEIAQMSDAQLDAALAREQRAIEREEAAYRRDEERWNQQTQESILFELQRLNRR